ncbi:MAG: class I SAM-dependent methyltransferase [Gammaproteobacteria bacterium]|nr:class I SAM-dependent methyltransferase [Gammaproteobacteria bacterium]
MNELCNQTHFQLRLHAFYQRIAQSGWRQSILYIGDLNYIPIFHDQKNCAHISLHSPSDYTHISPNIVVSTLHELPFESGTFDIIICHLNRRIEEEDIGCLNECERILQPNGKFIMTVNNQYSPYYYSWCRPDSNSLWSARSFLELSNFEILSSKAHSFIGPNDSRWMRLLRLKYERKILKYLSSFANKVSFVCIKKTGHYNPLPSYLRLSQSLSIEKTL